VQVVQVGDAVDDGRWDERQGAGAGAVSKKTTKIKTISRKQTNLPIFKVTADQKPKPNQGNAAKHADVGYELYITYMLYNEATALALVSPLNGP
jgi:hypothetical protein